MEFIESAIDWAKGHPVICALVIGGSGVVYYILSREQLAVGRPPEAVEVGKVTQVALYPFKSMRPLAGIKSLLCDHMGMKSKDGLEIRDRSWMVTLENGTVMTHRAEPSIALIQPSFSPSGDLLKLDAPGMPTLSISTKLTQINSSTLYVNVWGLKSYAVNCGKEAADWICKYLGKKGFLVVCHPKSMEGRKVNSGPHFFHKAFVDADKIAFADVAPVHLITESTIEDLQSHVQEMTITEKNFRPNICISGPAAYEEDNWDTIYIGDKVVLQNRILAVRCLGTTIDPDKGVKNEEQEPLKAMKDYRPKIENDPCLGLFLNVLQDGEVKVGDTVYAIKKK